MAYMDLEDLRPSFLFLVAAAVASGPAAVASPELAHIKAAAAAIVPAASAATAPATAPAAVPAAVPGPTTTTAHHAKLS